MSYKPGQKKRSINKRHCKYEEDHLFLLRASSSFTKTSQTTKVPKKIREIISLSFKVNSNINLFYGKFVHATDNRRHKRGCVGQLILKFSCCCVCYQPNTATRHRLRNG